MKREIGWYWVKLHERSKWTAAYFYISESKKPYWEDLSATYEEWELFAIHETRILSPDETCNVNSTPGVFKVEVREMTDEEKHDNRTDEILRRNEIEPNNEWKPINP